jgi:hypothetical protein
MNVAVKVFAHNHFCGQLTPEDRHLDIVLLENGFAVLVCNPRLAPFPLNLLKRMNARSGKVLPDLQT